MHKNKDKIILLKESIARIGQKFSAAITSKQAASIIMKEADKLFGWDSCYLLICSDNKKVYSAINYDTINGKKVVVDPPLGGNKLSPMTKKVLKNGAQLILRESEKTKTKTNLISFGNKSKRSLSLMFCPIRKGNINIGILSIQSYQKNKYNKEDLDTLQILADQCAGTLHRIYLEEKLKQKELFAYKLSLLGKHLSAARTPKEVGRIILRLAQDMIGFDAAFINVYQKSENKVFDVLTIDIINGTRREVPPAYSGTELSPISAKVLREGALLILRDNDRQEKKKMFVPFGNKKRLSKSLMYTPIKKRDTNVGILSIQSYKYNAYDMDDLKTLQILADHCSGALERTFVESKLRQSEEKLRKAHEELEKKVEERTKELSISYNLLKKEIQERMKIEEQARLQQEQLAQTDKLAALGTLISGIAHEINNPNNFIMLNIQILQDIWRDTDPILTEFYKAQGDFYAGGLNYSEIKNNVPSLFNDVYNGALRIKNIVQELRDFSRMQPFELMKPININDVVKSALVLINNLIVKSTNTFNVRYGSNIKLVRGNFQRLEQVVINLVQNACQALKDKSAAINVKTLYNSVNKTVEVLVSDEGVGIPSENLNKIFDRFFTTKREIGGTGLGLSISRDIAIEHNGKIEIESKLNKGTIVKLILPALENN